MNDKELVGELTKQLARQRARFQKRYIENAAFSKYVKEYIQLRLGYFEKLNNKNITEEDFKRIFDAAKEELARRLLQIYGHADDQGNITADFKQKARKAGDAYASASIWANSIGAIPGIARNVLLLGTQVGKLFVDKDDADLQAKLGYLEAAIYLGYAVAQLATVIYAPFWQSGKQDIGVSKQVGRGPQYIPDITSDQMMIEGGERVGLRKKKKIQLDLRACKIPGDAVSIDFTGPIPTEVGADYGDDDDYDEYEKEREKERAKRSRNQILWELNRTALYTQLVVNEGQSRNRAYRSLWNVGATAVASISSINNLLQGPSYVSPIITGITLYPLIGQPVAYGELHGRKAGEDYVKKIVTFFEIMAMTGLGDLLDPKTKKIAPERLDERVKGPMMLRLDYAEKVVTYDAEVYLCAIVGHLLEADDIKAEDAEFFSVRDRFRALSPEQRKKETAKIKTANLPNPAPGKLLAQYEKSLECSRLLKQRKLDVLLDDDEMLGHGFAQVLLGSLKVAAECDDIAPTPVDHAHDRTLMEKKGDALRLSDLLSSAQASQKWGQSGSFVVLGSAGFNILRLVFSGIRGGLKIWEPHTDAPVDMVIAPALAMTQTGLQLISSYFAWQLGYSQHKNTALKNVFRGRDKEKKSIPNQGVLDENYLPNFRSRISSFKTLLLPEISANDIPKAIAYASQTSVVSDTFQQMKAASLLKALTWKYRRAKGGSNPLKEDAKASEAASAGELIMKGFNQKFDNLKIREKIDIVFSLHTQLLQAMTTEKTEFERLEKRARNFGVRVAHRDQPWRTEKATIEIAIESANEELNDLFNELEQEIASSVCNDFYEYVQCHAIKFNPEKVEQYMMFAQKHRKDPQPLWKPLLKEVLSKYGRRVRPKRKGKQRQVNVIDHYLAELDLSGLEPKIVQSAEIFASENKLVARSQSVNDEAMVKLNKHIDSTRLNSERKFIETLKDLNEGEKDFLASVSSNFAYLEGQSFVDFATQFAKRRKIVVRRTVVTENVGKPQKEPIFKGRGGGGEASGGESGGESDSAISH